MCMYGIVHNSGKLNITSIIVYMPVCVCVCVCKCLCVCVCVCVCVYVGG